MKLFRLRRKPGSGEEERELVLDTDTEPQASPEDETDGGEEAESSTGTSAPEALPIIQTAPEANSEIETEHEPAQPEPSSLDDEPLDPALVDIFREAQEEAEQSALTADVDDIPVQDLLDDLVGLSRRLGIPPRVYAQPVRDEARDVAASPGDEEKGDADSSPAADSETQESPATGYRRYTPHALLLSLALAAAIAGGLMATGWLDSTGSSFPGSPDRNGDGYSKPPLVVATVPGLFLTQEGQAAPTAQPTPEASPEPTPQLQPAYFLYTVQPGDSISSIAHAFGLSLDSILWNNADVVYDPNLILASQELLIPSVDGIIYQVRPGDTLTEIAALYQIDVDTIVAFAPNGLTSPDNNIEGMVLILPGAVPPPLPGAVEPVYPPTPQPEPTQPPKPWEPAPPSSGHIWP